MPSLSELQQRFAAAVLDLAHEPGERIVVYRHTIFANYRNALGSTYRVVRELTGAPCFNAAIDAFVLAHPSTGGDLNVYGDALPSFLATYSPVAPLPYLPDVARLEWAMDEAHRAADAKGDAPRMLAALAAIPSDEIALQRFLLDPSCRLLHSAFQVLRIWQAHQDGSACDGCAELGAGEDFLVVRRESGRAVVERVGTGDFAWLTALAAGANLAEALDAAFDAESTFDLDTVLRACIANGTLSDVVGGVCSSPGPTV
jgi:hypothetical protein